MTLDPSKSASGAADPISGGAEDPNTKKEENQTVAYDTYRKVLGEKKKRDEELTETKRLLSEFQIKEKQKEEEELNKKGEFQKILQSREEELKTERGKRENLERTVRDGWKLDAFLQAVNGKLETHYFPLIDLDQIAVDPETHLPDPMSVTKVAKEFEQKYSRIIERESGVKLPNDAPKNGKGNLSYDEWLRLPAKEMKARLSEVIPKDK